MSNQTTLCANLRQLADDMQRMIDQLERKRPAIRDGQDLLAELDLRPDVGGPRNTD